MLESLYPTQNYVPGNIHQDTYDPALRPLYSHFLETLYSICSPFTHDPYELAYIAAARWPGFVKPLLMLQGRTSPRAHCNADGRKNSRQAGDLSDGEEELSEIVPPTEDTRIRLTRIFTPTFTAALEALYPRLTNAEHWARANMPDEAMLAALAAGLRPGIGGHVDGALGSGVDALPRLAKFVLVAAFLASTNPPKTDMRMFGRGRDERAKRRRRRGGGPRRPKAGSTGAGVKVWVLVITAILRLIDCRCRYHSTSWAPRLSPSIDCSLSWEYSLKKTTRRRDHWRHNSLCRANTPIWRSHAWPCTAKSALCRLCSRAIF